MVEFFGLVESVPDSIQQHIPSLSDRFNLVLPVISILIIFAFFIVLKIYVDESSLTSRGKRWK